MSVKASTKSQSFTWAQKRPKQREQDYSTRGLIVHETDNLSEKLNDAQKQHLNRAQLRQLQHLRKSLFYRDEKQQLQQLEQKQHRKQRYRQPPFCTQRDALFLL
ncbi:hypothetical protein AD933_01030 [Acetobacter malorum]|uniref:Uncharacterized protein n=1 Tax=Acetobacter malorum TaxID=178901 RepID=A0A149S302_9PROT|nr:hypothetical protein AD933_01030 [Acetobacter malorum]